MLSPPYRPVNSAAGEIRLLILQPASNASDPVVCTLEHATLGSNRKYEALSYAWGTKKNWKTITLDGLEFPVLENAEAALCRLRSLRKPRIVWIDAICTYSH